MLTCSETGKELAADTPVFVASRIKDPKYFPVAGEIISGIPANVRSSQEHTYLSGGINFYETQIVGSNGSSTLKPPVDTQFVFSLSAANAKRLLPKTCENFNFPGEQARV